MGAAYFYHLTRTPLEVTLPTLLEKSLDAGWRVAIRGSNKDRLSWLDDKLWHYGDGTFLPHGCSGGAFDQYQPILLTEVAEAANDPQCVMIIDEADLSATELSTLERGCILFDGNDEAAVERARGQWRRLTEAGVPAQYWSQESGRWQKKAEAPQPE